MIFLIIKVLELSVVIFDKLAVLQKLKFFKSFCDCIKDMLNIAHKHHKKGKKHEKQKKKSK